MRLTIKEREESMATGKALDGKPYAGNPHVRFDEGEVAPATTPRRGSLLYDIVIHVKIPGTWYEGLRGLAEDSAGTISQQVRLAIRERLERFRRPVDRPSIRGE